MKNVFALAMVLAVSVAGCSTYQAWSKRREARTLEKTIEKQRKVLQKMSPEALEQAEAESREKAIAQYEKILKDYADVGRDEMDEALYLLGRLLFEREQQEFQRGQQAFEQARQQAEAAGVPPPEEPKPRYPSAKAVYERLLKDFPDSTLREDALYDLGYILFEEGQRTDGMKLFETLVREKPKSRYAPEVHFRIAEYEFESYRLASAEEHYRAVLRFGQTDLTEKALFKLGWVYYNLERSNEAKKVLVDLLHRESEKIVREGRESAPTPILFFPGPRRAQIQSLQEARNTDLYEETLEIIARVYAESGGADALVSFLKSEHKGKTAPPYAAPLMHRLALVEKERSQFEAAARAYQLLLDAFPTFRDAPKIELEHVGVLLELKEIDRAARVREAMLEKYDQGSTWARANPEEEVRAAALKSARKALAWSIRYFHSRGLEIQNENGGVPEELRRAITLYEKYLARFPAGKASYEKRFRYAQALFAAGQHEKAAEVFRVVSFDSAFDRRREEAAFSRILSVEKLAEGVRTPRPAAVIETLVAAYEDFIKLNPSSERNAALLFKEGNFYFTAESFPSAIAAFERLIREHPADPLSAEANDLIAQAHFRLGEFAVAERWSEKAMAAVAPNNPLGARQGEVEKLFALTMFKQGEKADEEQHFDEATRHYLRLVDRLPQNEIAARALYNAASSTSRASRPPEAAALFERLLSQYPSSDLAADAAVRLAEVYRDQPGGSEKIIHVYERVADYHVEDPKGEEFLFLAGKLAVKENRETEIFRLFEKFLSRYRSQAPDLRSERNLEAFYHLGVTYAQGGNSALARQYLEQFLSRPRPTQASFGEGTEGYVYAVANAQLLLGDMLARDYSAIRLVPPVKENLKQKETQLAAVVDRYAPAVASGLSPLATRASFGIGHAYEEFAQALAESPKPAGLTAEERDEYDRLLDQQIRPYLLKAVEAYRATVRASREKSISDEWVGRCRERLAVVAPRVFLRAPRSGYLPLPAPPEPMPDPIPTFAGVTVGAGSGPGFFGSLVASDSEARKGAFARGLAAAQQSPPDWNEAAQRFLEASSAGPPEAGYNAAVALFRLGKLAEAVRAAEDLLRKSPDFLPAVALSARLYEQSGKRDFAAAFYRRAAEAPNASIANRVAWAASLERQKRGTEALAAYQAALATDPSSIESALGVARLGGISSPAELEKLITPLARSAPLLVELGMLAAQQGSPQVAGRAFAASRASLVSTDRAGLAIVFNDEAIAAEESGELDRAEQLLASAVGTDPNLAGAANTAGILRMRRGDFDAAETEFRKAIAAAPTFGAPWANLGILNELYFGAPEQAVDCYNRYLATRPPDESVVAGWIREIREGSHGRSV